jgi:hypothetical protein
VSDPRALAEATLARLGLALEADAPPVARLAELASGPDVAVLIEALGAIPTAAAAAALAALAEHVADRELRKTARRALHGLRRRGVVPPGRTPSAAVRPLPAPVEGLVSAFDGRGDRLVWLLRPLPDGGTLLVAARLHEPGGLEELDVAEVSRREVRAARRALAERAGLRLVAADWRVLDALLVEADARAAAAGRGRAYARVRTRLTAEPPAAPAEPVSARARVPEGDEAERLVEGSSALLAEPELALWWPPQEALAPLLAEVKALEESPLVLSPAQQEERMLGAVRRAAAALFPPVPVARRLEGTAYVLAETGRETAAVQALAVAAALRARPERAPEVPLLATLVHRALGGLLEAEQSRQAEARRGALVLTPSELRARASSRPPHTRG